MGGIPLLVRWYPRRLGGGFRKGWADVAWLGRLMDGVCILRVKLPFLLWGSGVVLPCSWFLPARLGPQPSRWRLCRLTDGAYPLRVKPLFLLLAKEKVVLDSEKEKVDQWKSWEGTLQPGVGFVLLWYPSGEGLWGIPFGSGGLRLSDLWSFLRHCR